ncbi:MAG: AprI/Inh family metalloprotease inhibitor [Caulobacteraceae bacterium]
MAPPKPVTAAPTAPVPQPAVAPPPGTGANASPMAGAWRLAQVGGKIDCTLTLTNHPNAVGRDIEAPIACQRAFPPLKSLSAWALDARGAPIFSDAKNQRRVTFNGPRGGPYAAVALDGKAWRLTAAPAKAPAQAAH